MSISTGQGSGRRRGNPAFYFHCQIIWKIELYHISNIYFISIRLNSVCKPTFRPTLVLTISTSSTDPLGYLSLFCIVHIRDLRRIRLVNDCKTAFTIVTHRRRGNFSVGTRSRKLLLLLHTKINPE